MLSQAYERFRREIRVYQAAFRHPRAPRLARWLLGAAIAYTFTPVDVIPDFIPVLGHLDDAIIVPALIALALRSMPTDVLAECRRQVTETPGIQATWGVQFPRSR